MARAMGNQGPYIDTQGEQTNPTTATVLADTGAMETGIYAVTVVASATALAEMLVQRRNAANGASVGDEQHFYVPANSMVAVPFTFFVDKNERIRVLPQTNLTGNAVINITAQRIG